MNTEPQLDSRRRRRVPNPRFDEYLLYISIVLVGVAICIWRFGWHW